LDSGGVDVIVKSHTDTDSVIHKLKVMDAVEPEEDAAQSCSNGGVRCDSAGPVATDDDDYGITPFEHDPFRGEGDEETEEALSEGWRRKAYRELQEKSEWRQRDIEELRNMVKDEQDLLCPTDDAFLLRFLRAQKFDYDKAFHMLQRYFLMRRNHTPNFAKSLPSLCADVFSHRMQTVLPHRDRSGRRVFLFRAGIWDPSAVSPLDVFAANYICLEMMASEVKSQIAGTVVIVDMGGFSWSHLVSISADYLRSVANVIQNAFPLRFREIHIINESYLFDFIFALIRPFLSETIKSRIHCHGENLSKVHSTASPDILPSEFGGKLGPMTNEDVFESAVKRERMFRDLTTYGYRGNQVPERLSQGPHPFQGYCMAEEQS